MQEAVPVGEGAMAAVIGLAQGIAVFPGLSRSGMTIAAALGIGPFVARYAGLYLGILGLMAVLAFMLAHSNLHRRTAEAQRAYERRFRQTLEDINLAGANGILVNVTAGMDLSIGEFQEVGNTIKEFASENATVVVGTVIDPDMTDQIRVTVVATGLGHAATNAESPMRIVRRPAAAARTREEPNYHGLDKPTVQRKRAVGDGLEDAGLQEELLDIPAFLRRQAD